jgi:cobalt-zinc-cadmium efflux system protein
VGGLLINLLSLYILEAGRGESINVRGAWLHVASDALASVGVIVAGLGIWALGWIWLDPTVSIAVSLLVLISAWNLVREALDVLMEAMPAHLDPEEIRDQLLDISGVSALHCLHVWTIGSGEISLSSHLVVDSERDTDPLLREVRDRLAERFEIDHTTIQIEFADAEGGIEPACGEVCDPASPMSILSAG